MTRTALVFALAGSLAFSAGCTSKKYVRQQTTPLIDKVNELDDITARNTNAIKDVDGRAQRGIADVNTRAAAADQKARAAGEQAGQAQSLATDAANRATSLGNTVANLDSYRPVAETAVRFGFDRDTLTPQAKQELDQLIAQLPNTRHYLVTVEGGADSTGNATYNYDLSQRRARAVIQYLAQAGNVPAHKIFVIGLGKDKPVASNASREGRARNRRVEVRLLTNTGEEQATVSQAQPASRPPQ